MRGNNASDFSIKVRMLDNAEARLKRNFYSSNDLAVEDCNCFKTTKTLGQYLTDFVQELHA